MEDNESSRFAKFQKALEDGNVTDEEKAEFRVQGLLGLLAKDIGEFFDQSVFENLKTKLLLADARLPAKFHVEINAPLAVPDRNKDVVCTIEYFSPALNAYACFKSSKNEPNSEAANCFFEAGIAYLFEWTERKKSVKAWLALDRTNVKKLNQEIVINEFVSDTAVTSYTVWKKNNENIVQEKSAKPLLERLKNFFQIN